MNQKPHESFSSPSKMYKDKMRKSSIINRHCNRDWLNKFEFISYSKKEDALFCLACVLFPDHSLRRPKKLITEGYQNWKDALSDLKKHASCEYHMNSNTKLRSFIETFKDASRRIDVTVSDENTKTLKRNRNILESIIKCLQFCGKQGLALRGHRDDDSCLQQFQQREL